MTSELILLFLYFGYMALRNAIDDPRRADRASAVLALVGAVNVPIIYFSVQWWNTLHQGSSVSLTAAPKMAAIMLGGMLIMAFAAWFYAIAVSLARVRTIMIERERDAAWVRHWRLHGAEEQGPRRRVRLGRKPRRRTLEKLSTSCGQRPRKGCRARSRAPQGASGTEAERAGWKQGAPHAFCARLRPGRSTRRRPTPPTPAAPQCGGPRREAGKQRPRARFARGCFEAESTREGRPHPRRTWKACQRGRGVRRWKQGPARLHGDAISEPNRLGRPTPPAPAHREHCGGRAGR